MALTPDEEAKIAQLGSHLANIDAGIETLNQTLTGALKMARIGREALERLDCECYSSGWGSQCIRCAALADIEAVAREFSP